ncbi:hypothetical protein C0Q88_07550 [Ralstonia pickettii]|uniref:Uncharacterized protein n=1 Tax=Ralstonia pickettii TaxID=329 RepID=A0A2N4TXU9_RALPI|nr:hypothetical protein [Ralstonia pickettii]PLC44525.1 hypothetical protein C0Q88_07550 [Ralstonia pickettii]
MPHYYYFLEVGQNGPDGEPVIVAEIKAENSLSGIEEGKDFVLEKVIHLGAVDRDALRARTETVATKYRIQEVLSGARLSGGFASEVTRVLLSHPKQLTDPSNKA